MKKLLTSLVCLSALTATASIAGTTCEELPSAAALKAKLMKVTSDPSTNGGFGTPVWLVLTDTAGTVCAVTHSLEDGVDVSTNLSLANRVFAAHKANTANAFSHNTMAVASGTFFTSIQQGGTMSSAGYLQTPLNPFAGKVDNFGTEKDPMIGKRMGGLTGLGGGLALYNASKEKVGAIGVSGDTPCTDHVIAWKVRNKIKKGAYHVDNVPFGVSQAHKDALIQDVVNNPKGGTGYSPSGFGHMTCGGNPPDANDDGAIDGND